HQLLCNRHQNGGVTIMATRVHESLILRRIWNGVFFSNGQAIHIGAKHQCLSRSGAQQTDHSGLSDSACCLVAAFLKMSRSNGGSPVLMISELGMSMEIPSSRDQFFVFLFG